MAKMSINITDHFGPGGLRERFLAAADKAAGDVADAVLQKSQELVPVDKGDLLGSGSTWKVKFLTWGVGYNAPYAQPVEFGARPHWAPFQPILDWVKRKRIRFDREGEKMSFEQTARTIWVSISKKGTPAQPFLRPALELVEPLVAGLVRKAMIEKGVAR